MLKVDIQIDSIDKLDKYIEQLDRYAKMQTDRKFQKYIQDKVRDVLVETMNERLDDTNTNSDFISLYWNSNYIMEAIDGSGFVLYNDAKIPANAIGVQNSADNYPDGMFSIALAFEYGVGIIGTKTDFDPNKFQQWEYNIKDYNFGWYLPTEISERYGLPKRQVYAGYEGYEIYRYTADKIEKRLPYWVWAYFDSKGEK